VVNATPTRMILWPGAQAGDYYNPMNNSIYTRFSYSITNAKTHKLETEHYYLWEKASTSEAQFVAWCKSIDCTAIFQVPAEADNATMAEWVVNYTENTLGLHPAFWEIGNEPGFWAHWGQSWGNWTSSVPGPTAMQYAEEVRNYTQAMRQADPTLRLIGLPAVGRTGPGQGADVWVDDIVRLDGPNLSAIAVHIYPDLSPTLSTLPQYFSTLTSANAQSIPARVPKIRQEIAAAAAADPGCSCANLPVLFTELGSAITDHPDGRAYAEQFPGALYIAAEVTQAMDFNITNVDAYATVLNTVNSWFDTSGEYRPEYTLYSTILPHLGPIAYQVDVTDPLAGVYAIATSNSTSGGMEDLLVVNTDSTSGVSFTPVLPDGLRSEPTEVWSWDNGTTPSPVSSFSSELPDNYTLPPLSLALFEARPAPAAPVEFSERGLPSGLRWFLEVDGRERTTTSANLSLLLAGGPHSVVADTPVPVPNETEHARWMPAATSEFGVGGGAVNISVPFDLEYTLNVSATPTAAGFVGPVPGWVEAGAPFDLRASPMPGYVFVRWQGGGRGNYTGTSPNVTLLPSGPERETAVFAEGFEEKFVEHGLPTGVGWTVTVRNETYSAASSELAVVERNGTYAYSVPPIAGYTPRPATGAFAAGGSSPALVTIDFVSPLFPVTFAEQGLPAGATWSVVIDNRTNDSTSSASDALSLYLSNGQYGYRIPAVGNYTAKPEAGSLSIDGTDPGVIRVVFAAPEPSGEPTYAYRFHEQGLPAGLAWTVAVSAGSAGLVHWSSATSNLTVTEPNGTYEFTVGGVPGFLPSPGGGAFTVNGSGGRVISVAFRPAVSSSATVVFPGLWTELFRALLVVAVIGTTGFATFGLLYWRRRRPPSVFAPAASAGPTVVVAGLPGGGLSGAG